MTMTGFDPEFTDLPDYIVKITERIWENRGVARIRDWYAPGIVMHGSSGPARGVEGVIAGTLDTLHAFPDRRLLAEDIIWSGDAAQGYLSSHRVSAPARHDGDSALFGAATGRRLHFRAIADCQCIGNRVVEEWLARDTSGIARQLGLDPAVLGAQLAAADMAHGEARTRLAWVRDTATRLRDAPPAILLSGHPAAAAVRDAWCGLWRGELERVAAHYDPACIVHVPGARTLHGHARVDAWLIGWLAAFPDAAMSVEHSIACDEPGLPVRVATRWWLTGTHTGHGGFGPASGATVVLMGMTHSEVYYGRVRTEWTVADELAVHRQIALHRLDV